jgi:hypothetical protein
LRLHLCRTLPKLGISARHQLSGALHGSEGARLSQAGTAARCDIVE